MTLLSNIKLHNNNNYHFLYEDIRLKCCITTSISFLNRLKANLVELINSDDGRIGQEFEQVDHHVSDAFGRVLDRQIAGLVNAYSKSPVIEETLSGQVSNVQSTSDRI